MAQNTQNFHIANSESYRYAKIGTFGFGVTPPKHKGFAISTGATTGSRGYPIPFDIMFRNSNGITFINRITVALETTVFFPLQISGISGNANQGIAASLTGLNAHNIYYYS